MRRKWGALTYVSDLDLNPQKCPPGDQMCTPVVGGLKQMPLTE